MIETVERRFGLPKSVESLSDKGSPYTAGDTRALARYIGLVPCTTPVKSLNRTAWQKPSSKPSNGIDGAQPANFSAWCERDHTDTASERVKSDIRHSSPFFGVRQMRSSTELEKARAYHCEAIRLRCEAETADEVLIRHQLRDIAQRYDMMAKTVEMIEARDGFPFERRGPGLHRAA